MSTRCYPWIIFVLLSLTVSSRQSYAQQRITISNADPRLDLEGKIVDAHDGRVIQFEGRFYWYGTAYGTTNGFTTANHYVCYSSDDMVHWKKEGVLLPQQPEGVYYRPHVIYNEKTGKYVLWYNWYPQLWDGQFGVATSDTPEGPFEIVNDNVQMVNSSIGLGDFGLFVDEDKTAYISYNTIQNHQVSIERLTTSYTASKLENGGVIAEHMEAGSMFKRKNKYYLLTDYTCCFCNYGSGARVYISDRPMVGYTYTGNINRYPGDPVNSLIDGITTGNLFETLSNKNERWQGIEIRLDQPTGLKELEIHLFTGNRPENCGDVSNPRVHPEFITPQFSVSTWHESSWKQVEMESYKIKKKALNEIVTLRFNEETLTAKVIIRPTAFSLDQLHLTEVIINSTPALPIATFKIGEGIPETPIIPAQQTYVLELNTPGGPEFIWMGDLWGSASDNVKGHDYQYWSKPLEFGPNGTIKPMSWVEEWGVILSR
ncbi:family 43 glycosylhydrolase [Fulvivirga sp. M361]|uniref:family 43 glycosylhydrolase n=1 Tax=Fulvivirga sp. M361 TaxID=2594266 RepID=UPI00117ABD3B|nr:family 43 glycosylhydrolase [Fulvivirga sp. M361]TRX60019.1 family 43 glycosylhydrolase [Fulvivirga sp. M361]